MTEEIDPETVKEKIENGDDVQIVDTRRPAAYADGHIPGAENVPLTDLANQVDEVDWGDEIVFVCEVGESSIQAGRLVQSYEGVDDDATVASMAGGYADWNYELDAE
ncbi:MAG: rhodanese-like domain-containing protein [Halobacteriaceae archaeon]